MDYYMEFKPEFLSILANYYEIPNVPNTINSRILVNILMSLTKYIQEVWWKHWSSMYSPFPLIDSHYCAFNFKRRL